MIDFCRSCFDADTRPHRHQPSHGPFQPEPYPEERSDNLVKDQITFLDSLLGYSPTQEEPSDGTYTYMASIERGNEIMKGYEPTQEVSVMDDKDRLFQELLIKEVESQRDTIRLLELDLDSVRGQIRGLNTEANNLRRENLNLEQEVEGRAEENYHLHMRLRPYEQIEREKEREEQAARILAEKKAQFEGVDPIGLLPSAKGWTLARKAKLVIEVRRRITADGFIPAIKFARDQFENVTKEVEENGYTQPISTRVFGLKEAKDFVDCIRAQM